MRKIYPLSAIETSKGIHISRGTKEEEAIEWIVKGLPRGMSYRVLNWLPINSAECYSLNHAKGWLYRKPVWMEKRDGEYPENLDEALKLLLEKADEIAAMEQNK